MDTILVNGTVGSGKTTLAEALGSLEPIPHAIIDLDQIRWMSTAPPSDPFNHELELVNLRSLALNYRRAGAQRFFLAGVVEHASEIPRYADALASDGVFLCRLVSDPEVNDARLRRRMADDPEGLAWHLRRRGELAHILEVAAIDDLVLDSTQASPLELARAARQAVGWSS